MVTWLNIFCYFMTAVFMVFLFLILYRKSTYMKNIERKIIERQNLIKTLEVTVKSLNLVGAMWWLEGGSLLGAIRNGKIINHDDDCDISVVDFEKYADEMKILVEKEGCKLSKDFNGIYKIKYKDQFTDIFPRYIYDEEKRYKLPFILEKTFPEDIFTFEDVGTIKKTMFEGIECNIPEHSEKILKNMYGETCLKIACITHFHNMDDIILNLLLPFCYYI